LDATRERNVIPLNTAEGTFFLNIILPMAYSKLYCESGSKTTTTMTRITNLVGVDEEKEAYGTGGAVTMPFCTILCKTAT